MRVDGGGLEIDMLRVAGLGFKDWSLGVQGWGRRVDGEGLLDCGVSLVRT